MRGSRGFAAIRDSVKPVVTLGPTQPPNVPIHLSEDERAKWMQLASMRKPPRPKDAAFLRGWLQVTDRKKYKELEKLMRWAEGVMERDHGLLPEDVRWLLP